MNSIYEYEDYNEYIRDYFFEKKKEQGITYRTFAEKGNFSSHSYCYNVIKGETKVKESSIPKFIKALDLNGKEALYFRKLVKFKHTKNQKEKEKLYKEINRLRRNSKFYQLNKHHYNYFQNWYYPIIRHLAVYADWEKDFSKLAGLVIPKITKYKAKKAVKDLEKMGLLIKNNQGGYEPNSEYINTDRISEMIKKKARSEFLDNVKKSVNRFGPEERYISYYTLSMSEQTYNQIIEMIENFQEKVVEKVLNDLTVERTYQMSLQLFPVSQKYRGKK